jgi:hypothetical protein
VAFDPVPGAGRAVRSRGQDTAGSSPRAASPSPAAALDGDEQLGAPGAGRPEDGGAGAAGVAVLAGALLLLLPYSVKQARRAQRRRAPPGAAVAGAWRELGDRLTERGQRPTPAMTSADLVRQLAGRLSRDDARSATRDLARIAGAVRFGPEPATTADADRAWGALTRVEHGLAADERWPLRVRATLDPRPALRG